MAEQVLDIAQKTLHFVATELDEVQAEPRIGVAALMVTIGKICGFGTNAPDIEADWESLTDERGKGLFALGWEQMRDSRDSPEMVQFRRSRERGGS